MLSFIKTLLPIPLVSVSVATFFELVFMQLGVETMTDAAALFIWVICVISGGALCVFRHPETTARRLLFAVGLSLIIGIAAFAADFQLWGWTDRIGKPMVGVAFGYIIIHPKLVDSFFARFAGGKG